MTPPLCFLSGLAEEMVTAEVLDHRFSGDIRGKCKVCNIL